MSESVPGTSGRTSPSSHEDLELSEGWLAEIFNDADMEVSSDYMNVSGPGDDLIDVAELLDTQPANEQHVLVDAAELHDTQPAHEQHVVQQQVSRSHPIIVFKGRKSMDLMPKKLATSVAYPFAFVKPSGAEGDVTLKEINQRIQTLPSSKPKAKIEDPSSYPKSTFSGKPVVSKVKVRTKGGKEAVEALRAGKVIAVPTDTLYGFACDACSLDAVNRIYEIKGRKHTSPLAICVGDISDIERFAVTNYLPRSLLDSLLPGPVTVVLTRGELSVLEQSLNPGLDSIGVRVPDYNFIRDIARRSGTALALTSANLSGQSSNVCINDFKDLWGHCAYVYDDGLLPLGRAGSTIVDLTVPHKYKILRPGSAMEETRAILEQYSLVEELTTLNEQ